MLYLAVMCGAGVLFTFAYCIRLKLTDYCLAYKSKTS